jgi:hypothetical protein
MKDNRKYFLAGSAGAVFVSLLVLGVFNISSQTTNIDSQDQQANLQESFVADPTTSSKLAACVPPDAVTGVSASGGNCSVSFCNGTTASARRNMGTLEANLTNTTPDLLVEYADMCLGMVVNQDDDYIARPVSKFESNIILDQITAGKSPEFMAQIMSQLAEAGVVPQGQNVFDESVVASLKKFQTANALTPTGYVDISTYLKVQHIIALGRMADYVNIVNEEAVKN